MQHWNAYWRNTKTLNSFAEGEQQLGYNGEIADFWQLIFKQESSDARILDVATGNGALAVLALQTNSDFSVTAIDAADIAPLSLFDDSDAIYPLLSKVKFIANTSIEHLNLESAFFDLVVSQFGFEYAVAQPALAQVERVLKPGGKFVALIHHKDSFITRDCICGVELLEQFLLPDGVIHCAQQYVEICEELSGCRTLIDTQINKLKRHSDALMQSLRLLQQALNIEQLDWFNLIAKGLVNIVSDWRSATMARLNNWQLSLIEYQRRLQDQIVSAWDEQYAEQLKNECLQNWQGVELKPIYIDNEVLCWSLILHKA